MSDKFLAYFESNIDYPYDKLVDILPMNTLWNYVSSSFLDGILNWTDGILSGYVLNRYTKLSDVIELNRLHNYQDPPNSFNWIKPKEAMTKQAAFDLYTQPGRLIHTKVSLLSDDVWILGKIYSEESVPIYIFFGYDQDTSDCSVGRFQTSDDIETIKENFKNYATSAECTEGRGALELPLHFFKGWLSR